MIARRQGEKGHVPFRSGRYYSVGVDWYAATREGRDLGPFTSQDEAKQAVSDYLSGLISGERGAPGQDDTREDSRGEVRVEELRQFMQRREAQGLAAARLWAKDRIRQVESRPMPFEERQERLAVLRYLLNQD
jgi:hypothetical protein